MLNRILLTMAIVAVGMACATTGYTMDWASMFEVDERWNFGINCSAVVPQSTKNLDTGVGVQGIATYDVLKFLAVGAEAGYTMSDFNYESIYLGKAHTFPVLGDVIVKVPLGMGEYTVVPYGVAGFGVLFFDVQESGSVVDAINTDTPFLMKFGGGIDFYLVANKDFTVALNGEASYHVADVKITGRANGATFNSEQIDVNRSYFGGGLKIRF